MFDNEYRPYQAALRYGVPIFLFATFFTLDILNPTRIGWLLNGDWGQHFLGWHAYRQTPLQWPFNHQTLLAHPTGLSLIYTDSNPLLALPLRVLSPILPDHFQYVGLWLLACVLLHYYIAYRLVARHAPGPWSAIGGATLLTLLPTLYNRIGHDTLCAHWLLLWALFIFFEIRDERKKQIGYAIVMGVTGFIHPYLLFMILAIWGADQIRWFVPMIKAGQFITAARTSALSALSLVPPVAALCISGAFSGQSAASDGFGVYGMPLDAFFNPGRNDFSLAFWQGKQPPRMAFEGFQYLGVGLLFLIGAAIYLYRKSPLVKTARETLALARPLKWPFVILLALAISDQIYLYNFKLIDLSFPTPVVNVLNIVRASGRLVWPLAYTAVFLSLICVYRARPKTMGIILGVAVALQFADIGAFAAHTKALTASATSAETFRTAKSPQWDKIIAQSDLVSFQPAVQIRDHGPFYEIILRALDRKVPVNMMYAARENAVQNALQRDEYLNFTEGRLDPRHLYVLLGHAVPVGLESRVRQIDGIWIIPPISAMASLTDTPTIAPFTLGKDYLFGAEHSAVVWAGRQWNLPDPESLSSTDPRPIVTLPYTPVTNEPLKLTISVRARYKGQHMGIAINGAVVSEQELGKKQKDISVIIPTSALKSGPLQITFINAPLKDQNATRMAGIQLYSLRLDHIS
ncbi:hypothetical protein AEAC466_12425 [Asticcacaulis sp. AC466]|uniref:DUF6311 domain-containing protein n=1 Tax=Asticcacaulis sp. AC466 TaxID=1282362 RepID=UPI0003C3BC52|nr:DUF6311 domain-containing protein [Asticcacaulis sp. AC466]ESQ83474.1 hypothetical protein AEAC466_12425 [Asticcacaulis sp. AC466]